jgi:hypothetical protein
MKWQPYEFSCPQCNNTFNSHRKDAKYCSRKCRGASLKKPPIIKTCAYCTNKFDARAKNHNRELKRMLDQKYCSRKCMAVHRAKYHNQENHHAWKGGVFEDGGYLRVNLYLGNGKRYMPGQHRLIVEEELNISLGELVVHHKDKNKSNNDIDNLQPMTRSDHSKHHYIEGDYFGMA